MEPDDIEDGHWGNIDMDANIIHQSGLVSYDESVFVIGGYVIAVFHTAVL